jgi:hypothetical protein
MGFKDFAMHEHIRRVLADGQFPMSRDQVLSRAMDHDVSGDVIGLLEKIADRQYVDAEDVVQATRQAQRAA